MNRHFVVIGLLTGGLLVFGMGARAQAPEAGIRFAGAQVPEAGTRFAGAQGPEAGTRFAGAAAPLITTTASPKAFPIALSSSGFATRSLGATPVLVDSADHWLVSKAAEWFTADVEKVTGRHPALLHHAPTQAPDLIIAGSLDASPLIQRLAATHQLRTDDIKGKWEAFSYQLVNHPFKGVGRALVIVGSDKRGTAYGLLELSRQMGVSPWYWWADVPPHKDSALYLQHLPYYSGSPGVKYRGIFINDEAPAFSGWTHSTFGGVNHLAYEKIFELLLRLKANYLWPAMWGNAFNDDDTLNPILADKYGIVMGTSHHEPMLRAQQEWKRYGKGPWNYETNSAVLQDFWRKGIQHMGDHESIVTIGMRGDGDMPMTEGSNIHLLEKIVADQRSILSEVTGKKASDIPQSWALYKEVQDYYDKGMRVPDDVTLLLCDDNWGNLRKLPKPGSPSRTGGYGIYYHFDYVGDPRNYKWINTNSIPRVWEQLHLAYENDVRQIWIVNVGDLKPMELPISFFLDYAWNPSAWDVNRVEAYAATWASEQFGPLHAAPIGHLLAEYTFYNSRRKPELLSPDTYSLTNYREADRVSADYERLAREAQELYALLPPDQKDAFFELVLYPIQASANLNDLYISAARNQLYARQDRSGTDDLADSVRARFTRDSLLSRAYNHDLAGGKWVHMMDQTHIGYTYWQQPSVNAMPSLYSVYPHANPEMGVAVEGSDSAWTGGGGPADTGTTVVTAGGGAALPAFNAYLPQRHYLDIYNLGQDPFDYTITTTAPWLRISTPTGHVQGEQRVWISADPDKAPEGRVTDSLVITSNLGKQVKVTVALQGRVSGVVPAVGFVENDGYVAMNADHYTGASPAGAASPAAGAESNRGANPAGPAAGAESNRGASPKANRGANAQWIRIPYVGRNGTGMTTFPVTAPSWQPGSGPSLSYNFYLFDTGQAHIQVYCAPTLDYYGTGGRRFAVSVDDEAPELLHLPAEQTGPVWSAMVADNIAIVTCTHRFSRAGAHVLHFWMVDPGVVAEKLVINLGGVKPSYLGPPETPMNEGLKDYFRDDFPIGVAVSPASLKNPLVLQQFNSLTPENVMKMGPIHPEENRYDFREADSIVAFARANGLKVRGHNLCWHEQTPAWLFKDDKGNPVTKEVLLARLKEHITTIVNRYKGKVYAWDVVNEAVSDDTTQLLRDSPWYKICGEDFIRKAFEYAHAADPDAQLFYNDYNTERPGKRERVYRLLKGLLSEGIPINGVGLQAHWSIYEPSSKDLRDAIECFASLGLKIQITELDMSVYPWEKNRRAKQASDEDTYTLARQEQQAAQYARVFDIFREYRSVITGVTFWNVTDKHTWLDDYPVPGRKNYPLLFDVDGQPKEAYWDVTGQ